MGRQTINMFIFGIFINPNGNVLFKRVGQSHLTILSVFMVEFSEVDALFDRSTKNYGPQSIRNSCVFVSVNKLYPRSFNRSKITKET